MSIRVRATVEVDLDAIRALVRSVTELVDQVDAIGKPDQVISTAHAVRVAQGMSDAVRRRVGGLVPFGAVRVQADG